MIATEQISDTIQARKKEQIIKLLRRMLDEVESDQDYGEFSVTFTAQNGIIGHYEETRKKTFK